MSGTVKEIFIYPIKSLQGIKVNKCVVTKHGIAHPDNYEVVDRKWMIIEGEGTFITQRKYGKMALIQPKLEGNTFRLTAPGKSDLIVPLKPNVNKKIKCRVWDCYIPGFLYDSNIGKWLSEFLETTDLNLVSFEGCSEEETRKIRDIDSNDYCKAKEDDSTIYSDTSPFLVISENSLISLNENLSKKVTIEQFRPNFYLEKCESAYAEDDWVDFKIGNVLFSKVRHCTRCMLTTIDPNTGIRSSDMEPFNTMRKIRVDKEVYGLKPLFGLHCALKNRDQIKKEISVNDSVQSVSSVATIGASRTVSEQKILDFYI